MTLAELKEKIRAFKAYPTLPTGASDHEWLALEQLRAEAWKAAFFFQYYNASVAEHLPGQMNLLPGQYEEGLELIQKELK